VLLPRGGREAFQHLVERTLRAARALTLALQNGSLQRYLLLLVLVALGAGGLPIVLGNIAAPAPQLTPAGPIPVLVIALGAVCAVAAALAYRRRFVSLLLLGAAGLVVAWVFVYLSGPDLALTQLLVELVTVVLMMLALRWLPAESPPEGHPGRTALHAGVAVVAGLGIALLAFWVATRPFDSISPYYLAQSVPLGGGANAVNVILVDFRGFDTLGEITVLGIAGLVVAALLGPGAKVHATRADGLQPLRDGRVSLMLALIARILFPFIVLVAIFLLLRGHNETGGGFIAGLVLAIGLILQSIANGQSWTDERLPRDFSPWIAAGLLVAGLTGIGSALVGSPFLTSSYDYPVLPLLGAVPLASAALFDLGVFLAVVGATMTMLGALGRLKDPR
jgi:multicomponent K+:H+ antiporter subunit A